MLKQQAIFIAEDEPFIALDLALAIEDADGQVIGPAASVEEALELLGAGHVDGAILDVNLVDRDITPVVVILAERGVPIILQSGVGLPAELSARFPHLTVHLKPCSPKQLIDELAFMLRG
ncbi:response regulator [Sphingomonas gei]|uniref:Response regulator n=1 Tax=Sphingomonas gei TaxID=1395960 RepID=A0A4S1XG42_9SPHN|nr:response regulator [Sphingomonas gei]TGX54978.1 response regulator [Sphingomonas gei]